MNGSVARVYRIPNCVPEDVNHGYWHAKGKFHKFLAPSVKAYKTRLKEHFAAQDADVKLQAPLYATTILLFVPIRRLRYKNGRMRGFDPSNYIKFIEDAYFEYLGVDDSYNTAVAALKVLSPDDQHHIVVIVSPGSLTDVVDHSVLINDEIQRSK